MIIRTPALALQIRPWSQTSQMVTWLTPGHGKIVTAVKGACRPKSAFLGQYDLFYTCDLLFYRRDRGGVHAIRECSPVTLRSALRQNWRHATAAAYLADLTAQTAVGHQETTALFELLTCALDHLTTARCVPRELIVWYETHLLRLLGLLPDFTTCPLCHPPERRWMRFSLPSGRFVCPHLAQHHPDDAVITLHRGVPALFHRFSRLGTPPADNMKHQPTVPPPSPPPENLLLGLCRFLGIFIPFHLDVPSVVRRVTFEMIDTQHICGTCAALREIGS
ncbi:MAG TPA: DNA repair protein RecO [Kiritimatiellia bacterium]|nr:DNA repair protein RecO [Kiritimatiellia bacterium]